MTILTREFYGGRRRLWSPHLATAIVLLWMSGTGCERLGAQSLPGTDPPPRVMTLRESVALALRQNPDVLLARLDGQQMAARSQGMADPFSLKLSVGSGLAYTTGFPMNVGGSGPSLVNAQAAMTLFDRPQRLRLQESRERAKAAALGEHEKQRVIALDVARAHLEAEALRKSVEQIARETGSLERLAGIRRAEVEAGRALPLDVKLASAQLARGRLRLRETESALLHAEQLLAFLLGMEAGARVTPAEEDRRATTLPDAPEQARQLAVRDHPALAVLDRELAAAQLQQRAAGASHWPVIRLVSQYSMFSRFNNYDSFYNRFERHNGQIGASFELPLFTGKGTKAAAEEANVETERLRLQRQQVERRAALEASRKWQERQDAWASHEVASLDLEAARERVGVMLARSGEGRAPLAELEQARVEECQRWAEYYRSRAVASLRDLELLSETGQLLAHLDSIAK